jgi:hypothetical protein
MVTIILAGRTDIEEYFEKSGIRDWKKLNHTPLLVFGISVDKVEVQIVYEPPKLLDFPDETKVMGQWSGEWQSDFFQFTVGQFRQHITNFPKAQNRTI